MPLSKLRNCRGLALLALLWPRLLTAAEHELPAPRSSAVDFAREIRPILAKRCVHCHGPDEGSREAGLRLDTPEGATAVLDSGQRAIVPGQPAASELIRRVTAAGAERMPPEGKPLTPDEIELLGRWVLDGGHYTSHWAYVPPRRPAMPQVRDTEWPRGAIDRFVLARLEAEGLKPAATAEAAVLLRRVHLDLTGLPPAAEEIEAFEHDPSPAAYQAVVDKLLAAPQFGEKWARQWLDLAGYADSNGYQGDAVRTNWPWRDWVIRALNEDMPFDEFTIAQVAGDLAASAAETHPFRNQSRDDLRLATAFFRHTPFNAAGDSIAEEVRANQLFDRVSKVGAVWLGTTLECAQCHSHKFDPVSITDYYRLFAYFNAAANEFDRSAKEVRKRFQPPALMEVPLEDAARATYEALRGELTAVTEELDAVRPDVVSRQAAWEATAKDDPDVPVDIRRLLDRPPGERKPKEVEDIEKHYLSVAPETKELVDRRKQLTNAVRRAGPPRVLVLAEDPAPRTTHVLRRGNYQEPGEPVAPGVPEWLHPLPADASPSRIGLAKWLVDPAHPLTARVTVNRWWGEIFGRGIVPTSDDFGTQGELPTHPELLDWLALEFAAGERPWSMKHILRLIVTSATYCQSSSAPAEQFRRDPHNELLARGPRLRLDAELIRDQALAVSGRLARRVGGPPAYPPQPAKLWDEITGNEDGSYPEAQGADRYRRGIYTVFRRGAPYPSLQALDWPERSVCVARRRRTNTPSQALVLLNDPAFLELYAAFARRILDCDGDDRQKLTWAIRTCVARRPRDEELRVLTDLVEKKRREFAVDPRRAEQFLEQLNVPREDHSIDLAAWSLVSQTLLNLDETITRN